MDPFDRWQAAVLYRTDEGIDMRSHGLRELADLHEVVAERKFVYLRNVG